MIKYVLYDVVYFILWLLSGQRALIRKDGYIKILRDPSNDYYFFVIAETIDICLPTFEAYKKRINKIKIKR